MYSFLTVVNERKKAVRVFLNDEPFFFCVLPGEKTKPKRVMFSSCRVIVKTGLDTTLFDLFLPIKKEASHTLILGDTSFCFI